MDTVLPKFQILSIYDDHDMGPPKSVVQKISNSTTRTVHWGAKLGLVGLQQRKKGRREKRGAGGATKWGRREGPAFHGLTKVVYFSPYGQCHRWDHSPTYI